jgi:diguanylate cyclase
VFLPGAAVDEASQIAQRIRMTIWQVRFPLEGDRRRLSVSVGGVVFDRQTSYDELFIAADRSLYVAKANGRNQVKIAYL